MEWLKQVIDITGIFKSKIDNKNNRKKTKNEKKSEQEKNEWIKRKKNNFATRKRVLIMRWNASQPKRSLFRRCVQVAKSENSIENGRYAKK